MIGKRIRMKSNLEKNAVYLQTLNTMVQILSDNCVLGDNSECTYMCLVEVGLEEFMVHCLSSG